MFEVVIMEYKAVLNILLVLCLLLAACSATSTNSSDDTKTSSEKSEAETSATTSKREDEAPLVLPKSNIKQFDNSNQGIYNYCPSVMQMADGTAYIYYCTNKDSNRVIDYIGCRKGTRQSDGNILWGYEKIVLSPTEGSWDAMHTCDPSVVAGDFNYNGENYKYLMAYLGCTSTDNQENKIGFAVAKTPEGPFLKVGNSPFIDFTKESGVNAFQWGVGQPSLINFDKQSKIILFYTKGDKNGTRTIAEEWELSNLNSPVRNTSVPLSVSGLTNLLGGGDIINNADFAYDSVKGRFYASSDCHPNPEDAPDFISSHFRITYFSASSSFSEARWRTLATVGVDQTKYPRNHNTGILRDEYGHMIDSRYVTVFYTMSITGSDSLWSYRIYNYNVKTR